MSTRIFTLLLLLTTFSVTSAQTIYNANFGNISFLQANKIHKTGTDGTGVGNKTLYTGAITIGGQSIDCIVTTVSLTTGTFTLPTSPAANSIAFDYYSTTGTGMSANDDRFFAPTFNFNTGGGNCKFRFEFIQGGSYNNSTNTGTPVILQNVMVNTYDIDGNGGTSSNQYNEFGGFSAVTISTGTNVTASYNGSTGMTRYRSNTNVNTTAVTADANRIMVKYDYVSQFEIVVGSDGAGAAYYFLDFGYGVTWTGATTVVTAPEMDLDPSTDGINYTTSACKAEAALTTGTSNITQSSGTVDSILYEFSSGAVLDGNSEALIPKGSSAADTLKLGFSSAGTQTFTFKGVGYTADKSVSGSNRKIKFLKTAGGSLTSAQAEELIDSLKYINTKSSPTMGTRSITLSFFQGFFKSAPAISNIQVSCSTLPVNWVSFSGRKASTAVELHWATSTEINVKEFLVQYSTNGLDWHTAGTVTAQATNNSSVNHYNFFHTGFTEGINYYRIAEKDLDGTIMYSKTITVTSGKEEKLQVYPNPATSGLVTVSLPQQDILCVYTSSGNLVMKTPLSAGTHQVNISQLSKGYYLFKTGSRSVMLCKN